MTHTPGPWKIEDQLVRAAPEIITSDGKRRIARVLYHTGSEDREVDGNAWLIAVVPDLLEACEGLVNYRDTAGPFNFQLEKADDFIRLMRLTIAKVRGKNEETT